MSASFFTDHVEDEQGLDGAAFFKRVCETQRNMGESGGAGPVPPDPSSSRPASRAREVTLEDDDDDDDFAAFQVTGLDDFEPSPVKAVQQKGKENNFLPPRSHHESCPVEVEAAGMQEDTSPAAHPPLPRDHCLEGVCIQHQSQVAGADNDTAGTTLGSDASPNAGCLGETENPQHIPNLSPIPENSQELHGASQRSKSCSNNAAPTHQQPIQVVAEGKEDASQQEVQQPQEKIEELPEVPLPTTQLQTNITTTTTLQDIEHDDNQPGQTQPTAQLLPPPTASEARCQGEQQLLAEGESEHHVLQAASEEPSPRPQGERQLGSPGLRTAAVCPEVEAPSSSSKPLPTKEVTAAQQEQPESAHTGAENAAVDSLCHVHTSPNTGQWPRMSPVPLDRPSSAASASIGEALNATAGVTDEAEERRSQNHTVHDSHQSLPIRSADQPNADQATHLVDADQGLAERGIAIGKETQRTMSPEASLSAGPSPHKLFRPQRPVEQQLQSGTPGAQVSTKPALFQPTPSLSPTLPSEKQLQQQPTNEQQPAFTAACKATPSNPSDLLGVKSSGLATAPSLAKMLRNAMPESRMHGSLLGSSPSRIGSPGRGKGFTFDIASPMQSTRAPVNGKGILQDFSNGGLQALPIQGWPSMSQATSSKDRLARNSPARPNLLKPRGSLVTSAPGSTSGGEGGILSNVGLIPPGNSRHSSVATRSPLTGLKRQAPADQPNGHVRKSTLAESSSGLEDKGDDVGVHHASHRPKETALVPSLERLQQPQRKATDRLTRGPDVDPTVGQQPSQTEARRSPAATACDSPTAEDKQVDEDQQGKGMELDMPCSFQPISIAADMEAHLRDLELLLSEAQELNDEVLEARVAMAVTSNRLIRLKSPITWAALDAAEARMHRELTACEKITFEQLQISVAEE